VPYNYTLGQAAQYISDLDNAASQDVSSGMMMIAAFTGKGSQNLQRTYQNANGRMTYAGSSVPMFQDAASFHLGFVAHHAGYGRTLAQLGGSAYDLGAQGLNWMSGSPITHEKAWDNNSRDMNSISGGADFANSYVPGPNPFNPGILLEQGYVPQSNINQDRNALNAFLNPTSGSIGRSALIF
jgi:hypothetical protein